MTTRRKKNLEEEHDHEEIDDAGDEPVFVQELNMLTLYGDVNEKRAKEIVTSLFHLQDQIVKLRSQ